MLTWFWGNTFRRLLWRVYIHIIVCYVCCKILTVENKLKIVVQVYEKNWYSTQILKYLRTWNDEREGGCCWGAENCSIDSIDRSFQKKLFILRNEWLCNFFFANSNILSVGISVQKKTTKLGTEERKRGAVLYRHKAGLSANFIRSGSLQNNPVESLGGTAQGSDGLFCVENSSRKWGQSEMRCTALPYAVKGLSNIKGIEEFAQTPRNPRWSVFL